MNDAFSDQLFEKVLLAPARNGARDLYVLSGYASPSMVTRHLKALREESIDSVSLDLIVGMVSRDGISTTSLMGFQNLSRQVPGNQIKCRFNVGIPNHSKLYLWCNDDGPVQAFSGSANYTQTGFGIGPSGTGQIEACSEVDPIGVFDMLIDASAQTISCHDPELQQYVNVVTESQTLDVAEKAEVEDTPELSSLTSALSAYLPLVQTTRQVGEVHNAGAGLNWGQRGNRNKDEAYVPIPAKVRNRKFFPDKGVHFQIITDDGDSFIGTVAQSGDKALETPQDNGILGRYFRRKLGLRPGDFVGTKDLARFGANAARISQIAAEVFLLEFKPGFMFEPDDDR